MRLIILGAGGFGRVAADVAAQLCKYEEICFLDDLSKNNDVMGKVEDYVDYINSKTEFFPAFGNNEFRLEWVKTLKKAGAKLATIIHPTAYISPTVVIGDGVVILPKASVGTASVIGQAVLVNMGAIVDHNCCLGNGCHVCLGAIIKADNKIPDCLKIEAGHIVENRTYWSDKDGN